MHDGFQILWAPLFLITALLLDGKSFMYHKQIEFRIYMFRREGRDKYLLHLCFGMNVEIAEESVCWSFDSSGKSPPG